MTPERKVWVVRRLKSLAQCPIGEGNEAACREAADALEAMGEAPRLVADHAYRPHLPDPRFCGCGVAAELHASEAPKSAEASMKERIEGLESFIRRAIPIFQIEARWGGCKTCDPGNEGGEIFGEMLTEARALLHGPSDPDRERETLAEVVKP